MSEQNLWIRAGILLACLWLVVPAEALAKQRIKLTTLAPRGQSVASRWCRRWCQCSSL